MHVRRIIDGDLDALMEMAAQSGFPYPDPSKTELILVVADGAERPLMAVAAERILQLYLWKQPEMNAVQALRALRLLHDDMALRLREMGYSEVNAFLPPTMSDKFGRRLQKTFGWVKNWASWCRTF